MCSTQHALCSESTPHKQALSAFYLDEDPAAILWKLTSTVQYAKPEALMLSFPEEFVLFKNSVSGEAIKTLICLVFFIFSTYILLLFPTSGNVVLELSSNVLLWAFPGGSVVNNLPTRPETGIQSLDRKGSLEKEMETHSSILARKISWTEKPGELQSMGLQRIRHNRATEH